MKTVIKVLAVLIVGFGLVQLTDLTLYLMNRSDSYLFNIGLIMFAAIFLAFGFLGLQLLKIIKPEKEETKQENEL